MIVFLIGSLVWAILSNVLGLIVAVGIRVRSNHYPEGESFWGWYWRVAKLAFLSGLGVFVAIKLIVWLWQLNQGDIAQPAWLDAPMWLGEHWWLAPIVFAVAAVGYTFWWHSHRAAANEQLENDDTDDEYQPPVDPTQQMWTLDQNTPHWQTNGHN